jgi:hypothetical protein
MLLNSDGYSGDLMPDISWQRFSSSEFSKFDWFLFSEHCIDGYTLILCSLISIFFAFFSSFMDSFGSSSELGIELGVFIKLSKFCMLYL